VETYQTEDEQLEALKRWWQENGRSTVIAIALALGAGFGWQGWQNYQQQQATQASLRYEMLMEAVRETAQGGGDITTLKTLAEGIKTDYSGSAYADFAALHLARVAVHEEDLAQAEQELRWVLGRNPAKELKLLAELRLARVVAARGNAAQALAILQAAEPGAYAALYAEAEGDAALQLGDKDSAVAAYERALNLAAATDSGASEVLRLKLESLTPVAPRALASSDATAERGSSDGQ
jgi:predicted negative regulator of RcsB-dependent stress response